MCVNIVRSFCALIVATLVTCAPAQAEKRVALVIGNSAYKNTLRLTNPVNDAALVGDMFKKAGFDAVDVKTDLNASEMRRRAMNPQGVTRTGKRVSHRRLLHKRIRPARSYAQMPAAGPFVPAASWDDRRALPLTVAA
ncbi:hypothetical protein ABH973_007376 [Bradyrhizobium ottawaense]